MDRPDDDRLRKKPVGFIPAGSSNNLTRIRSSNHTHRCLYLSLACFSSVFSHLFAGLHTRLLSVSSRVAQCHSTCSKFSLLTSSSPTMPWSQPSTPTTMPLDSISQQGHFGWGMFGAAVQRAQNRRWPGQSRYDVGALVGLTWDGFRTASCQATVEYTYEFLTCCGLFV